MRLRHGCGVYAYTKEVFGDDHAFLCAWFLYISHISIVFLNTTALFVVARLLMGNAQLSTPSYVLAGRDGMPRKRRQRQSCAVFGHAEHPPHAGRRHSAFGNMFTKKHMHPRINRAFWAPPPGGLGLGQDPDTGPRDPDQVTTSSPPHRAHRPRVAIEPGPGAAIWTWVLQSDGLGYLGLIINFVLPAGMEIFTL